MINIKLSGERKNDGNVMSIVSLVELFAFHMRWKAEQNGFSLYCVKDDN